MCFSRSEELMNILPQTVQICSDWPGCCSARCSFNSLRLPKNASHRGHLYILALLDRDTLCLSSRWALNLKLVLSCISYSASLPNSRQTENRNLTSAFLFPARTKLVSLHTIFSLDCTYFSFLKVFTFRLHISQV